MLRISLPGRTGVAGTAGRSYRPRPAGRFRKPAKSLRIEPLEQRHMLSGGTAAEMDWFSQTPDADPLYKLGDMAAIYRMYEETGSTADLGAKLAHYLDGDRVSLEVLVNGPSEEYVSRLEALGMEVVEVRSSSVGGLLPIEALDDLTRCPGVLLVLSNYRYRSPQAQADFVARFGNSWHRDSSAKPEYDYRILNPSAGKNEVRITFWTENRIENLQEFLATVDWPEKFAGISTESAEQLLAFRLLQDPRDGFRTIVKMDLADAAALRDSLSELEQLDCIDQAKLERESVKINPGAQEAMDAITTGHSDKVAYGGPAELVSGPAILIDDTFSLKLPPPIELPQPVNPVTPPLDPLDFIDVLPPQTVDLGVVDFVKLEDQTFVDGELWYRFEAARDGILAAHVFEDRDPPQDSDFGLPSFLYFDVSLFEVGQDGSLQEVARGGNGVRYDAAKAYTLYKLQIRGVDVPLDISIANQISVDADAGRVNVFGYRGEDTLEFRGGQPSPTLGSANRLTLNGFSYQFDAAQFRDIQVHDVEVATLHGNDGDETLYDEGGLLYMGGVPPRAFAELSLKGDWGRVAMEDERYLVTVIGHGGYDTAFMSNSWRSDYFFGSPDQATMKSPDFEHTVIGFDEVRVSRPRAESSVIELRDSAADDHLLATPEGVTLSGDGYSIYVQTRVYVQPPPNVQTPANVHVFSTGGNDTSELTGSSGDDLFVGKPDYASLSGDQYSIEVYGFASVKATAGGGTDIAKLYDSPGDDLFIGKPDYGALSGDGFSNEAYGFDGVHAYATAGGIDLAKLFDSAGDDIFYADPVQGALYRPGEFYNRAKFFEGVHAYATGGGHDTARLFGTDGSDIFVGMPDESALFGKGYYNRAKYFDEVYGDVGTDAYRNGYRHFDKVKLYDTPGNDTYSLLLNDAEVRTGDRLLYRVTGIDTYDIFQPINAHDDDADTLTIGNEYVDIDYNLDLTHWE